MFPSVGTASGGDSVVVKIMGSGFDSWESLIGVSCFFGDFVSVGRALNAQEIMCTTPRSNSIGYVDVSLGFSATKVAYGPASFMLVDFREDFIVQPTMLVVGSPTTVTIFSGSFSFAQTVASAFCNIHSSSDFWPLSIQGKSATCQVNVSRSGSYFLRTFGLAYVNSAGSLQASGILGKIEAIPSPSIASITPLFASFDGNTLVTVRGENFVTSGLSLQCIFGLDFTQGFIISS